MNKIELISVLSDIVKKYHSERDLLVKMDLAKEHISVLMSNVYLLQDDISDIIPEYEVWRNINGFEGLYQISNYGNIRSVERFFIKNKRGGKEKMAVFQPEKIRTRRYNPAGYVNVSLWSNGVVKHCLVHRLVAIHFNKNPDAFPQVLHKDDNPGNPRWDNLDWGTQSQNINDSVKRGRWHVGSKNYKSKLTEQDIPKIRQLLKDGNSAYKVAKEYGIAKCAILGIKNNTSWVHVK